MGAPATNQYTRQQWAVGFLQALGNNNPTQKVIDWVVNWSKYETAAGQGATYNLLNTTQKAQGSSSYNSAGVQNFISFQQGAQTNASVLLNSSYYAGLANALLTNNEAALGYGGSPSNSVQNGLNYWCKGDISQSCYSAGQLAKSPGSALTDAFSGFVTNVTKAAGGNTNTTFPSTCPPFDLACGAASFFSSNQVRQVGLLFIGLILLLIGIEILFFGKGKEESNG